MKRSSLSKSGFLRLGMLRLFLPIALLWGGGQSLYTALTNRQPLAMTFADYVQKRPSAKWVELKDVEWDLMDSVYSGFAGNVSKVYVPLRAAGDESKGKVQVLLLTREPEVIKLLEDLKAAPKDSAVPRVVAEKLELMYAARTVRGLVMFGIDSNDKERRKIAKLSDNLAEDFTVIEEGKKPEAGLAIVMCVLAVLAVWLCWLKSWGKSPSGGLPPPLPPAPPPLPPGLPPPTQVR